MHVCIMYRLIVKMTTTRPSCDTEDEQIMALIYQLQQSKNSQLGFTKSIFEARLCLKRRNNTDSLTNEKLSSKAMQHQ